MAKALTRSDIAAMAERWATHTKRIAAIEAEREKELEPLTRAYEKKTAPINEKYDALADPLQEKADAIEGQITEWLDKQTKTVEIESRSAIAELVKGVKEGPRVISVKSFLAFAKQKGDAVYDCVTVAVAKAEKLLGKTELDKISTRAETPYQSAVLRLKD